MDNIREPLISKKSRKDFNNPIYRKATFWDKLKSFFGYEKKIDYKIVRYKKESYPYSKASNCIDNRKTSIITFIPKLLYNEFKQFLNFYFLILCLSQFVPALQVGKHIYKKPLLYKKIINRISY